MRLLQVLARRVRALVVCRAVAPVSSNEPDRPQKSCAASLVSRTLHTIRVSGGWSSLQYGWDDVRGSEPAACRYSMDFLVGCNPNGFILFSSIASQMSTRPSSVLGSKSCSSPTDLIQLTAKSLCLEGLRKPACLKAYTTRKPAEPSQTQNAVGSRASCTYASPIPGQSQITTTI